jgi:Outer membrane protein beta-barrel domain
VQLNRTMKKSTLVVFSILLYLPSFAQTNVGVKGGLNLNNISDASPFTSSIGFNIGMYSTVRLTDLFFLQGELLYSVKGAHFPATTSNGSETLQLNYFTFPIFLGIHANSKLSVIAGFEWGLLLSANSHFDNTDHDVSNNFGLFDKAIDLGVTYTLSEKAGIEMTYSYGIKDLENVSFSTNIYSNEREGRNMVLQAGIYYILCTRKDETTLPGFIRF